MSTIVTEGVWTRHQSAYQGPSQNVVPSLEEVLSKNKARRATLAQERAAVQENQGPSSESTSNRGPGVVSRGSPVTRGRDVWNEVF